MTTEHSLPEGDDSQQSSQEAVPPTPPPVAEAAPPPPLHIDIPQTPPGGWPPSPASTATTVWLGMQGTPSLDAPARSLPEGEKEETQSDDRTMSLG